MVSTYPFGNDPAKIAGYQAFWQRAAVKRPLVGFSFKSWFPLQEFAASEAWQSLDYLTPDMVAPQAFMADQERLLREGETIGDDILRGACPSQAVPWLSGMLGARLRILPGSILGEDRTLPWHALENTPPRLQRSLVRGIHGVCRHPGRPVRRALPRQPRHIGGAIGHCWPSCAATARASWTC